MRACGKKKEEVEGDALKESIMLGVWTCKSQTAMLVSITDDQGPSGGLPDSGFTGELLCGSRRLEALESSGVELREVEHESYRVRFGGGMATTFRTFEVKLGPVTLSLGVVKGALPLLIGMIAFQKLDLTVEPFRVVVNGKMVGEVVDRIPTICLLSIAEAVSGAKAGSSSSQSAACFVSGKDPLSQEEKRREVKKVKIEEVPKEDEDARGWGGWGEDKDKAVEACAGEGVKVGVVVRSVPSGRRAKNSGASRGEVQPEIYPELVRPRKAEEEEEVKSRVADEEVVVEEPVLDNQFVDQQVVDKQVVEELGRLTEFKLFGRDSSEESDGSWEEGTWWSPKKTVRTRTVKLEATRGGNLNRSNPFSLLAAADDDDTDESFSGREWEKESPQSDIEKDTMPDSSKPFPARRQKITNAKKNKKDRDQADRGAGDELMLKLQSRPARGQKSIGQKSEDEEDDGDKENDDGNILSHNAPTRVLAGKGTPGQRRIGGQGRSTTTTNATTTTKIMIRLNNREKQAAKHMRKLHRMGHASATRMLAVLKTVYGQETANKLKNLVNAIVENCEGCKRFSQPVKAQGVLHGQRNFNEQVHMDTMQVNLGTNMLFFLICIDISSSFVVLQLIGSGVLTDEQCYLAFETGWATRFGRPQTVILDEDRLFMTEGFVQTLQSAHGCEVQGLSGTDVHGHGAIERQVRSARYVFDRMLCTCKAQNWTAAQLQLAGKVVENTMNNDQLVCGFSASQRAMGRGSSIFAPPHQRSGAEEGIEVDDVLGILEIRRAANEAYWQNKMSRTVATLLRGKERKEDEGIFEIGTKVYFFTNRGPLERRRAAWRGPAQVVGRVAKDDQLVGISQYLLKWGSRVLTRSYKHVSRVLPTVADVDLARVGARDDTQDVLERLLEYTGGYEANQTSHLKCQACDGKHRVHTCGKGVDPVLQEQQVPALAFRASAACVKPVKPVQAVGEKEKKKSDGPHRVGNACMKSVPTSLMGFVEYEQGLESLFSAVERSNASSAAYCDRRDCIDESVFNHEIGNFSEVLHRSFVQNSVDDSDFEFEEKENCWLGVGDEDENSKPELKTDFGGEAYGLTWNDVPLPEQKEAWKRSWTDYDGRGSWERGTEKTKDELKQMGISPMEVREVEKAKHYEIDGKWVLKGRVRQTPKGFQQRNCYGGRITKQEVESPTAHRITQRVADVYGLAHRLLLFTLDIGEAFFTSKLIADDQNATSGENNVWTRVFYGDEEWKRDELFEETESNKLAYSHYWNNLPVYRKLLREVPGTKGAPAAFYRFLTEVLLEAGWVRSRFDPCCFFKTSESKESVWDGMLTVHVDDLKVWCKDYVIAKLNKLLEKRGLSTTFRPVRVGESTCYCGERLTLEEDHLLIDQERYVDKEIKEIELSKDRAQQQDQPATEEEVRAFRGLHGKTAWVTGRTRGSLAYEDSYAASAVHKLKVKDLIRLNKLARSLKFKDYRIRIPRLDIANGLKIQLLLDAGTGEPGGGDTWTKCLGGKIYGIMENSPSGTSGDFCTVLIKTGRLSKQTHSSLGAETVNALEGTDLGLLMAGILEECLKGLKPNWAERIVRLQNGLADHEDFPIQIDSAVDAKDLIDKIISAKLWGGVDKSLIHQIAEFRELCRTGKLRVPYHIDGMYNEADCLVRKEDSKSRTTREKLESLLRDGYYTPYFKKPTERSTKKKKKG